MVPEPLKTGAEPRIEGYRIEGVLGRGATGTVYRARQVSVDRVVALKVLHPDLVGTRAERRLQREARTTARLAHPNIISAIDMGVADGRWWYAMELIEGISLQARIQEKPLNEREALRLFLPLCDALQHAFEKGVVHRDIKPANILIERGGRALIVDLGLAASEDDPSLTRGGGTLGTPHYISPEQARDPKDADSQSDLWSLGATIYHAVCGRPPFEGDSVAEILSNVLYARIGDPRQHADDLSSGFVLVLRKCLTRDRRYRYATPAELMNDLERLRERRTPRIETRGLDTLERPGDGRRRTFWIAAAAVLVCASALFFVARDRTNSAPLVSGAPAAGEDALDTVARAVEGDTSGLSEAWNALARARQAELDPARSARGRDLASRLAQRFDAEFDTFRRTRARQFQSWLDVRDFAAAAEFTARGARTELAERFGARTLPESVARDVEGWTAQLDRQLAERRDAVDAAFEADVDRWWQATLLPRVDKLQESGEWRSARELLLAGSDRTLAASALDARGVTADSLRHVRESLQARLDTRRAALDEAWNVLDDALFAWVDERVEILRSAAEARTLTGAALALRESWQRELVARKLDVARFPNALPHTAHERVARGEKQLADVEKKLSDEDARAWFEELEAEAQPLWKARRFGEVAERYALRADEPWIEPVRAQLKRAVRETKLLDALLARAAQGVRAKHGKTVELSMVNLGTVHVAGRIDAGLDPQTRAFRLVPANGREWLVALREAEPEGATTPQLLNADSVEVLARAAREEPLEAELVLALVLLRVREGDIPGARATFAAGPLPPDEVWVTELGTRLLGADGGAATAERRTEAQKKLRVLTRELAVPARDVSLVKRIDEFLAKWSDALTNDELASLRQARDKLAEPPRPATLENFVSAYALPANAVQLTPPGRATLRFVMRTPDVGTFERGDWVADGVGWSPPQAARSDAEMLARPAPTLALVEPLKTTMGAFDAVLMIEQPAALPPRLLVVSLAGCHFVFTGAESGRPARVLIDTGDVARVVERARAGEGQTFAGWKAGHRVELHFVLQRSSKWAQLEIDGRQVANPKLPQLTVDAAPPKLSVRAWEPLRLVSVEIEGGRR